MRTFFKVATKIRVPGWAALGSIVLGACVHSTGEVPIKPTASANAAKALDSSASSSNRKNSNLVEEVIEPVILPPDPCQAHKMSGSLPWFVAKLGVVITQASNSCLTRDGLEGFKPGPELMIMGFPCTAGNGRLAYQGHYYLPKIASFILSTECPMLNAEPTRLLAPLLEIGGFPTGTQLVTLNPFVTQYWELQSFPDADVGFAVELTSNEALNRLWHPWKEGKGFDVRLYGRENSWIKDRAFYEVRARIEPYGRSSFKLVLLAVAALNKDEENKIKERCEKLQPKRRCDLVFI